MPIRLAAAAFLLAAIPTLSQAQEASAFAPLVAAADVAKGTTFAKRCAACHAFEKDAGNKVGPNLWGDRRPADRLGRRISPIRMR